MTSVPAPPHEPSPGERVLSLLPVHVRARDEQAGGLLAALADAVDADDRAQPERVMGHSISKLEVYDRPVAR